MRFLSSLDFWTFVVAVLAFLATVWYGRAELRFARQEAQTAREEAERTLRNQEEQLQLARREAENRPVLAVSAMDLLNPVDVDAVVECAQERKEWLDEWACYEQAKEAHEQRRAEAPRVGDSIVFFDHAPQPPDHLRLYNNYLLMAQQDYDGPFPDWVLRVTVINKGKTAALDLSGQLYLGPSHLEPLDFPGLDGNVEVREDGTHRVNVDTGEGSRLLPAPTTEELTFDVAVLVKQPGTTPIRYAFATPQGDNVESSWSLDIPRP